MKLIVPLLLGGFCIFFFLEMLSGPWKWLDRLMGIDDHPDEEEIVKIQLDLLLDQEDLSVKNNRVVCNDCLREGCGFCLNDRVIKQAQALLDKRNEL